MKKGMSKKRKPFPTFNSERGKGERVIGNIEKVNVENQSGKAKQGKTSVKNQKRGRYMGELYSSASIAKQYLRLLQVRPLLEKQPTFRREFLGYGAAAYFGGRAEVRVRKRDVPVRVVDFTSMYPTVFCLQRLDKLLVAARIEVQPATAWVKGFLTALEREKSLLYDSKTWLKLNCLVLVDPNWAILPVRFRTREQDPYTIAVTPLQTPEGRWYTLADVIASVQLGGPPPKIRRALRFVPKGRSSVKSTLFRGAVPLRSNEPFFKTIVEQRSVAKRNAENDKKLAGLEMGLKQMAASGAYGIYAEINVQPSNPDKPMAGRAYADVSFESPAVHDERPGAFGNPIIASLITGGARLKLAMLEREVTARGGTFAFCDTDSLAIVSGAHCPADIPCLSESAVVEIIERFDALSPYDPATVPHLLKLEYPSVSDLRCFAVSAKRYVLYRIRAGNRIQIVKASEAALGAIIGRSRNETTAKLACRIWLSILLNALKVNPKQRRRAKPLVDFDMPLRRKFPITQPSILKRLEGYNRPRSYDHRIKPFGFVQSVTAAVAGAHEPLPIAPYEADLAKSKRLTWFDYNTGKPISLDWHASSMHGTTAVTQLSEYVHDYQEHAEGKAADLKGAPAREHTIGLLGRLKLESKRLNRIGKEVDRLKGDDGASLTPDRPVEYECDKLATDIAYLGQFPQEATARDLGLSVRGWRNLAKGVSAPRKATMQRIRQLAADYRGRPDY